MKKIFIKTAIVILLIIVLILAFNNFWDFLPFSFKKGATKTDITHVLSEAMPKDIRIIARYSDTLDLTVITPVVVENKIKNWAKTQNWLPDLFKKDTLMISNSLGEEWRIKTHGNVYLGYTDKHLPYALEDIIILKEGRKWNIGIKANYPQFVTKDFGIVAEDIYSRPGLLGHSISADSLDAILNQNLYYKFDSIARIDVDLQQIAIEHIHKDILYNAILFGIDVNEFNIRIEFKNNNKTKNKKNYYEKMD